MDRIDAALLNRLIDENDKTQTLENVVDVLHEIAEVACDPGDMPAEGLRNLLAMVSSLSHGAESALTFEMGEMRACAHQSILYAATS